MAGENIVALCDVDDRRAAETVKRFPQARRYKDFRRMLDEMGDKIDAVLVGTPDHTHAVAAMAAMNHGKHVYCEKPLAHSVAEVRALRKEAQARKLITQVGNQGHSSDSIRVFCEWIWDGAIGKVTEVQAGCNHFRDFIARSTGWGGPERASAGAAGTRLGPVARPVLERPYHSDYCPWNWRGWMPYGSGAWATGLPRDRPGVLGSGPGHADEHPGRDRRLRSGEAGRLLSGGLADHVRVRGQGQSRAGEARLVRRPAVAPPPAELDADRGLRESGAVVIGDRENPLRFPRRQCMPPHARDEDAGVQAAKPTIPRSRVRHHREWLDAVREDNARLSVRIWRPAVGDRVARRPCDPFDGRKLVYDERAMRFTNCDEANVWLNPPCRAGWTL